MYYTDEPAIVYINHLSEFEMMKILNARDGDEKTWHLFLT